MVCGVLTIITWTWRKNIGFLQNKCNFFKINIYLLFKSVDISNTIWAYSEVHTCKHLVSCKVHLCNFSCNGTIFKNNIHNLIVLQFIFKICGINIFKNDKNQIKWEKCSCTIIYTNTNNKTNLIKQKCKLVIWNFKNGVNRKHLLL